MIKQILSRGGNRWHNWTTNVEMQLQYRQLRYLLRKAKDTEIGRRCDFARICRLPDDEMYQAYCGVVHVCGYESMRAQVMRMVQGEPDVLWPGVCRRFAQSSGTSGGKSKYIPVTRESLSRNHYPGARDAVAFYLNENPGSRMFRGKGLILGGSFANELHLSNTEVKVGDLSAHLIEKINPLVNIFRIPGKEISLMSDWEQKLPRLVEASRHADVTNISGVPSWFLTLLQEVLRSEGKEKISDVWPHLEVFFHGGISFEPYRGIYSSITDATRMHYVETYNASEGFFAAQNELSDHSMLILPDRGVFYEFVPMSQPEAAPISMFGLQPGEIYRMIISTPAGLWRYDIGDTLLVCSLSPLKIKIAGRTQSYINAFGEEVMEHNANHAIAAACRDAEAAVRNYTVAPVYANGQDKGCHQWLIEWEKRPADMDLFTHKLDEALQEVNSDYQAKRRSNIFLGIPQVTTLPAGAFDQWLAVSGNGKRGGQRKIPRLSNDRRIADFLQTLLNRGC